MFDLPFGGARERAPARPRTLIARAGGVWLWPGVALTEKAARSAFQSRRMSQGFGSRGCMARTPPMRRSNAPWIKPLGA